MDPAILAQLAELGLRADPAWAASHCKGGVPVDVAVQSLLTASLTFDLRRVVSGGSLPQPLDEAPSILPGPFLLQICCAEDVSVPAESRATSGAHANRALRFTLTDGSQDVPAFEWQRLPAIPSPVPIGAKLICRQVPFHHGLLLLAPENTLFVGGAIVDGAAAPQGAPVQPRRT